MLFGTLIEMISSYFGGRVDTVIMCYFTSLGTQPPVPSWGSILNESREFMELAPWLAVFPGLAIIFAVLAFNFLGDALRDALDPRLSQR